ncbi:type III-B CRISPR module RAMP protein Cmr6 [Paenibacillus glufosinatiresistens]|uniref:type III-B CRISPR module RAMP protein Cmr6 n=1 Tax=Paenibacillus glufosinatiresistens TaxID=3070657 RepID=UPI00286DD7EF|nr:type III-B CRISPR module RAMP protein Cmr6 [Paenibacillus sp. YX.27]
MNPYLFMTKSVDGTANNRLEKVISNKEDNRSEFYKKVIEIYKTSWKDPEWIEWYEARYNSLFERKAELAIGAGPITIFTLDCQAPAVVGQGQSSVLETHVSLHPVYGFPYFPGTAIKGAASHYCHQILGRENSSYLQDGAYYKMLFGDNDQSAVIHYEDAWPTPASAERVLTLDVLTPHHRKYQNMQSDIDGNFRSERPEDAPRDDDSPVPIHFLAVQGSFSFRLELDPIAEGVEDWLPVAERIVKAALGSLGLGGKTSSGYGLFA